MIQPQPAQRGTIGEQHGLQRLTTNLEALEKGQRTQETRDAQIQTQLTAQAATVAQLSHWVRWQLIALMGLAVLTLGLGGLIGWQLTRPPDMTYARGFGAVDATLVQTWPLLPKTVQEQIMTAYARQGLLSPGYRK